MNCYYIWIYCYTNFFADINITINSYITVNKCHITVLQQKFSSMEFLNISMPKSNRTHLNALRKIIRSNMISMPFLLYTKVYFMSSKIHLYDLKNFKTFTETLLILLGSFEGLELSDVVTLHGWPHVSREYVSHVLSDFNDICIHQ